MEGKKTKYFVGNTNKTIQGSLKESADESKEEAKISSEDHHWRTTQPHTALLYVEELYISTDFCNPEVK